MIPCLSARLAEILKRTEDEIAGYKQKDYSESEINVPDLALRDEPFCPI